MDIQNIIQNQATICLGTIGHVAHGKSTLVKSLTGIKPAKFKKEIEQNGMTIKLGYAGFKLWQCGCPRPECFTSTPSEINSQTPCTKCGVLPTLKRHFSFVDCPGHNCLMATMLSGAAVMDGALLIVAANENIPMPQTEEHLAVADLLNMKNVLIIETKCDLVNRERLIENRTSLAKFTHQTCAEKSPIIPIVMRGKDCYNLDVLLEYLCEIPQPIINVDAPPMMSCVRSFDINKPGCTEKRGGVIGGTIHQGVFCVGDDITVFPGKFLSPKEVQPFRTIIKTLYCDKRPLNVAVSGGLIAVGTDIDSEYTRADRMQGQVIVKTCDIDKLDLRIVYKIKIKTYMMSGVKDFEKGQKVQVNISSARRRGIIIEKQKKKYVVELELPVCLTGPNMNASVCSATSTGSYQLAAKAIIIDEQL